MSKFIPFRTWIPIIVILYIAIEWLVSQYLFGKIDYIAPQLNAHVDRWISTRILALCVWGIIALILWKFHWFWKVRPLKNFLSNSMFPLLQGEWQFTLESNWPIIDSLKDAAKSKTFDVLAQNTRLPEYSSFTFRAKIHQSWFSTQVEFLGDDSSVLDTSRTLSVELLGKTETEPQQVAWVYRQWNKQGINRKPNLADEANFLGAALMRVTEDGGLKGHYWTNRSWERGLNAAGIIVGKKLN